MPVIILSASSCTEAQQSINTQACPPSGFATRSSQMHMHTLYAFSSCAHKLISSVPHHPDAQVNPAESST